MAAPIHTYGPSCFLATDASDPSSWLHSESPPNVRPQFFYTSPLPIDDPLTALPPPSGGQGSANAKAPLQPYSVRDNAALEEAWKSLQRVRKEILVTKAKAQEERASKRNSGILVPGQEPTISAEWKKKMGASLGSSLEDSQGKQNTAVPLSLDDKALKTFRGRFKNEFGSPGMEHEGARKRSRTLETNSKENLRPTRVTYKGREPFPREDIESTGVKTSGVLRTEDVAFDSGDSVSSRGNTSRDASISGSPFIRAPIHKPQSLLGRSVESNSSRDAILESSTDATAHTAAKRSGLRTSVDRGSLEGSDEPLQDSVEIDETQWRIPVGASRLHLVELPKLKMKPIYWSPLHDISHVVRATWFYKNTMLPVETELANKLEDGYLYLQPWTETWQDELNSCVENGADAELKVVHQLWAKEDSTRPSTAAAAPDATPFAGHLADQAARPDNVPFALDENRAAGATPAHSESVKPFLNSSVIYADWREAQILRPSLLPSVSRGRRPLSAIRKGRQIGIPVVRGFSRRLWDRLHPSKPSPVEVRNYLRSTQTRAMSTSGEPVCYACAIEELRPAPTDLVLVIHGIGQKLSERMESFHFTHAINAFRRTINMELNSEPVWPHVRPGHAGIMALPVNWRSTLSLDEANLESPATGDPASNHYSLKDITPETIPAVRSLISDVMLDIPYYLSHHKPKMIQAVVKEANRIFRLWCENNPGFQQNGRVHLLAHSLGSAMALDILSHQPTKIPRFDFSTTSVHGDIFEFDTKNLFICGSPAGFFLFLNKANLLPRRGRDKPGCEGDDRLRGVAGEADTYGCLAVDNLYNIMHTTDPIAYRVNAAVDSDLAASLKPASIPTTTSTIWSSFGNVFRWSSTTTTGNTTIPPPAITAKLPTQVELETHDFTREEIAEKRMLLLNDNGQIDYYLSGGGGPLNIQYLNMLSAHSSYWTLTDFVRFVVIEIARKQGREATLPVLRAEKKKGWRVGKG